MITKKKILGVRNTLYVPITRELADYLELKKGDEVQLLADYSQKHGRFVAFWNPEQENIPNKKFIIGEQENVESTE